MDDTTAATRLFHTMLADHSVAELAPLRDEPGLDVRSVAVNGSRVDVVAGTTDDEWRVVFGSADMTCVEWVSVFARPARFDGIAGGRAIVINGASSSGKSTLLRALASRATAPWVIFDEPMFGTVRTEHLIWRQQAPLLHIGFLQGIAALARAGNLVALAAGGHPFEVLEAAFAEVPTLWVGLDCAVDELERRERGRVDVAGGLWAASPDIHDGWTYDLRLDTQAVPVDEQCRRLAALLG
jgi:chloramphenicol 3-O phosphotransferase